MIKSANNTTNANAVICNPKNKYTQPAFNNIWAKNRTYAKNFSAFPRALLITKNNANPSNAYKIVHAAPKTTPGGVNPDLFNVMYHKSESPCGLKNTPKIPGKKEIIIATHN